MLRFQFFQFSLRRSLVAVGLLSVALFMARRATGLNDIPRGLLDACGAGIALAASAGAITRRVPWLVLGAAIGAGTCFLYMECVWRSLEAGPVP